MEHRRHGVAVGEHQPKLARIRKVMGIISAALWVSSLVQKAIQGPPGRYSYRPTPLTQMYANLSVWIDQHYAWHLLPLPLGLIVLIGDRIKMRMLNLHDTSGFPSTPQPEPQAKGTEYLRGRMAEGTFNDKFQSGEKVGAKASAATSLTELPRRSFCFHPASRGCVSPSASFSVRPVTVTSG